MIIKRDILPFEELSYSARRLDIMLGGDQVDLEGSGRLP